MEIGYIYAYENSIMKPNESVRKRGKEGEVEWKYNAVGELVQGTIITM
jgi:hypothetical protein